MCSLVMQYETRSPVDDYTKRRNNILREEEILSLGGKLTLTEVEQEANNILMQWKRKEIDDSFHDPQHFNFSKHYFAYKQHIETSKVFQIIRKMPKAAALHVHSSFMLDADGLLDLTYEDHLYACYHNDLKLQFSDTVPTTECRVKWTLLSELRDASDNVTLFDEQLKRHFTLAGDDDVLNAQINEVWIKFEGIHKTVKPLIGYRPAREKYFYKTLERFYADNVMYIEIRSSISNLYELDGTKHDKIFMARLYRNITKKFIQDHPDFIGVKLIITCYRAANEKNVLQTLDLANEVKAEMPEMFAGFDLVGQEDLGQPLTDFISVLKKHKNNINYFFHAGETAWFGSPTDENLIDAILMNSKRIGHAYALLKHPRLLRMVYEKDIGLEINVISNAVLSLVRDVRNHPLATYLALDMPVVLSSDDPSAWGAQPLSHDFYVAFVIVASRNYDLRMLKQLALNSIKYSALDLEGKDKLLTVFNDRWFKFIEELREGNTELVSASSVETDTIEPSDISIEAEKIESNGSGGLEVITVEPR